jgi:hypothetical protein
VRGVVVQSSRIAQAAVRRAVWERCTAAFAGTHEREPRRVWPARRAAKEVGVIVRGALTFAAGAVALVAAGCGGEERLSQEEFQKQGNAICAKYDKQIEEIGTPTSVEEVPAYVNKVLPIVERQIEDMKELNPPERDQEAFDEMIAEAEKTVEAGRDLGEASEASDDAAIEKALNEGNSASDRADQHATELGLTDCVEQAQ